MLRECDPSERLKDASVARVWEKGAGMRFMWKVLDQSEARERGQIHVIERAQTGGDRCGRKTCERQELGHEGPGSGCSNGDRDPAQIKESRGGSGEGMVMGDTRFLW